MRLGRMCVWLVIVGVGSSLPACRADPEQCVGLAPPADLPLTFGGDRPTTVLVSPRYDHSCPTPLLVILHGYGVSGILQGLYFDVETFADDHAVIIATPDGTTDPEGNAFWNAGEVCCDFGGTPVDDVGYLRDLIAEISASYTIDPARVYVAGHSNGGFMAYRLACELGDDIAAIASLAGASPRSLDGCAAGAPSVLQIHGTADDTVLYDGGSNILGNGGPTYPGAAASVALWAAKHACASGPAAYDTVDFDLGQGGVDTERARYRGCAAGRSVELWTIEDGGHVPVVFSPGLELIWQWAELRGE